MEGYPGDGYVGLGIAGGTPAYVGVVETGGRVVAGNAPVGLPVVG
jgi:hypothetical protein